MSPRCPHAALQHAEPHPAPYSVYEQMRAEHGPIIPVELGEGVYGWLVTDYETIVSWSRDTTLFTRDSRMWKDLREGRIPAASPLMAMMAPGRSIGTTDGSEHQRLRGAVVDSLRTLSESRIVQSTRDVADRLVDSFCESGEADLLNDYGRVLPLFVMADLCGFSEEQATGYAVASRSAMLGIEPAESVETIRRILSEILRDRRENPGDDLVSRLVHHPAGLTEEEAFHQLRRVMGAANEPVAALVDGALRMILGDPHLAARVRDSRTALEDVVDQVLWKDPPISHFPVLYPRADVPVGGGRVIRAGEPVLVAAAAANHFYARENAREMAETTNRAHMAWGIGPHRCPAQREAVAMGTEALRVLLGRLPGLRTAVPQEELRWRLAVHFWSPIRLPAAFPPQKPVNTPVEGWEAVEEEVAAGKRAAPLFSFLRFWRR
ncbi:cytochrome P450 [Nocardiopsis algeriensis]|uniref:cytochrome P450 n=1 Tax=Nocardiopsis algeriensis TaxID=1478215 RepID=UPI003B4339BD